MTAAHIYGARDLQTAAQVYWMKWATAPRYMYLWWPRLLEGSHADDQTGPLSTPRRGNLPALSLSIRSVGGKRQALLHSLNYCILNNPESLYNLFSLSLALYPSPLPTPPHDLFTRANLLGFWQFQHGGCHWRRTMLLIACVSKAPGLLVRVTGIISQSPEFKFRPPESLITPRE